MFFDSHFNHIKFLHQLGYLHGAMPAGPQEAEHKIGEAIATAQRFYGLPETGTIDHGTARVLQRTPRCGCPDVEAYAAAAVLNRWAVTELPFYIADLPRGLGVNEQSLAGQVRNCFAGWQSVCGLTFRQVENPAQARIILRTARGRQAGFDGPSGTLAYAYLPRGEFSGQLEMVWDADEAWTLDPGSNGILFGHVTYHEIGHLLGLTHTSTRAQLMLPTYSPLIGEPQTEDRARVVQLYGQPKKKPATPAAAKTIEVQIRAGVELYAGTLTKR